MYRAYLIENNAYYHSPESGIYVVYTITVGEKKYVGATRNYKTRVGTHSCVLEKKIRTNNKETYSLTTYSLFTIEELKQYKYRFDIYCYCDNAETAKTIEQQLLNKYKTANKCLNQSDKSGLQLRIPVLRKRKVREPKYARIKRNGKYIIVRG